MKNLMLVFFVVFSLAGYAQPVKSSVMFEKTWGSEGPNFIEYVDETEDGDFILTGWRKEITTQNAGRDLYVCKLDYQGNILWEKDIGYPYEEEQLWYALKTKEQTYLLAALVSQAALTRIINIDKNGNILFDVILTNNSGMFSNPYNVSQAADGGFFIGGTQGNSQISYSTIIKLDAQGNEQWRQLNTDKPNFRVREIEATPDGGCIVAGNASSSSYYYNTFVEKIDANGNPEWYQYPYGINDTMINIPKKIFVLPDGSFNFYVGQSSVSDPSRVYAKLFMCNPSGIIMDTLIHNFDIQFPYRSKAQIDPIEGGYVIANNPFPYTFNWFYHIYPDGGADYKMKFTPVDSAQKYFTSLVRTKDGGYFGAGVFTTATNNYFYAVKFASDQRYQHSTLSATIQTYPNPTNTGIVNLVFDLETDEELDLEVWSVDGKLILQDRFFCPAHSLNTYPVRFDLKGVGAGMYMLKVRSSSTTYFEKLVVDY